MSAKETSKLRNDKLALLALMDHKNDDSTEVSAEMEVRNTNQRQADNLEEFRDRLRSIIDGAGKTYSSSGEELPRLPAYDPSFKNAEKLCIGLVKEAQSLLKSSPYQDEETARLVQLASESQNIPYPPARRIGLVGDSAAGKSTLVNALLDSPGLAIEGASGRAATCVITEYKHAWPGQKTPFMAEIKFYGLDKIRTIIQHEFRAYYNYSIADTKNESREIQEELSTCQETAVETFKALFANRYEFSDEDAIDNFFGHATYAEDKNILHTLYKWVEGIMVEYGVGDGLLCLNAHSVEELAGKVEPFTNTCTYVANNEGRPTPSLWPLVEIVRVGLHSRLLKHGLVVADLPGLSDVNKTRLKTTTEYTRRCEAALLVVPIARVETDILVHKRLREYHRMFGNKKALVVTKVDEVRALNKIYELEPTPEAAKEHERLVSARTFTNKELSRLVNSRDTAGGMEKETLTQKISNLQLVKKSFDVLVRQALIIMRNEKSGRCIRRKYKKITTDQQTLPSFAVSSSDYNTHVLGFEADDDGFLLPVDTTGIPALRRHCYQFPAKSHLDALTHYREGILAELISSMHMWSSQYKVQRRSALKKVVAKPLQETEAIIDKCIYEIKLLLDTCILEKSRNCQESWIKHSTKALNEWIDWHARTFDAFCRHYGAWETGAQSYCNWNTEMLEPVVTDLTMAWENFDEALTNCKEKIHSNLISLLEQIRTDLAEMDGVAAEPMLPFLASLAAKKVQLRQQVEKFFAQVNSTSRITKLNVDMIDQSPDCFLMRAMSPVYARCAKPTIHKGRQKYSVQCTLLEDAISKGVQFSKINPGIQTSFDDELEKQQPKFVVGVQKVFDKVLQDFDSMFVVEELPNPKRDALRYEVQRFVKNAQAEMNGPIEIEFAKATKTSA